MKYLGVVILILLPLFSRSTSIIIINTGAEIYIGADSKRTFHILNTNTGILTHKIDSNNTYCKITKSGKYYFAVGGFYDNIIRDIAAKYSINANGIDQVLLCVDEMKHSLQTPISNYRTTNPEFYTSRFSKGYFSSVSFAYFQNDTPKIVSIYFELENPDSDTWRLIHHISNEQIIFLTYAITLSRNNSSH